MKITKDLSKQERVEIVKSAITNGILKTSKKYGVNRKTISKWVKQFRELGERVVERNLKPTSNKKVDVKTKKQIIEYKKNYLTATPKEIKKQLELELAESTIYKILQNSNLSKKEVNKKILSLESVNEPFELLHFSVDYLKDITIGDYLKKIYRLKVKDFTTGFEFIGYSFENCSINLTIFTDYIIGSLSKFGLIRASTTIISDNKNIFKSKTKTTSLFQILLTQKYDLSIVNKAQINRKLKTISKKERNSYLPTKYKNLEELIVTSALKTKEFNKNRYNEFIQLGNKISTKNRIETIFHEFPLILLGETKKYLNIIKEMGTPYLLFQQKEVKQNILNQIISIISEKADKKKKQYDNLTALDVYDRIFITLGNSIEDKSLKISTLLKKVDILKLMGEYKKSEYYAIYALELSNSLKNDSITLDCLHFMGDIKLQMQNLKDAKYFYLKSLNLSKKIGNEANVGKSYGKLGIIYYQRSEYNKALECHLNHYNSVKSNYKFGEMVSSGNIALVLHDKGEYKKAKKYYEKQIEISQLLKHRDIEATAFGNLGALYHDICDYKESLNYYDKQYTISKEIGDILNSAIAVGNKGIAFYDDGNYEKAIENYSEQLKIAENIGHKYLTSIAVGNIGLVYHDMGNFKFSIDQYNKKIELCKKIGNKQGLANAEANLAEVLKDQGDFKQSLDKMDNAIKINREIGYKYGLCYDLQLKAEISFLNQKFIEAKELCLEAKVISKEINRVDTLLNSIILLEKLDFYTDTKSFEKVELIFINLLKDQNDEKIRAKVYYELAVMQQRKKIVINSMNKNYAKEAIEIYKSLHKKTPNFRYKCHIVELTQFKNSG